MNKELLLILGLATGAAASGCTVFEGRSTAGEYVDDKTISTQVKAKFAQDPTVSAMQIEVESLRGEVQLSGFAKSEAEKDRAEEIARGVRGVREVQNDIIVRS